MKQNTYLSNSGNLFQMVSGQRIRSQVDDKQITTTQKSFFRSGQTRPLHFRRNMLKRLKKMLQENEQQWLDALREDFGKPPFEAYASEVGFLYEEINFALKNLRRWSRRKRVSSPLATWPSRSYIDPVPKGSVLIIGPWNYPLQLSLAPAVAAIAAGNTCVIKPPEQTPVTSQLLEDLIRKNFDPTFLTVVQGAGHEVVPSLMQQDFDHVFFTGSTAVGRKIAEMAAPRLTPVTLELGGKSPAVITPSANLQVSARRIAFGKWLNAGQTCVAPDYLLIHKSVKKAFLQELCQTLQEFYPADYRDNPDYTQIINESHFQRLLGYLQEAEVYHGGDYDEKSLKIAPTILDDINTDSNLMREEIFGPLLPVLSYESAEERDQIIAQNPNPLSFYVFSEKTTEAEEIMNRHAFGGGAINNAIVHLSNPALPFGGIGTSGMGAYHGKAGFDTFSHYRSVMKTATWFDLRKKYPPYNKGSLQLVKKLMK